MVPVAMVLASRPCWKMTPGDRTSWDTTTRSVPLMMNVPFSVIIGKSPMKTVCSLISPVWAFMKRAVTKRGREKVISFSLHSSSEYFGGSNSGSASSSFREPVKSSMGDMSVRVSAIPSSRNDLNESRCRATHNPLWYLLQLDGGAGRLELRLRLLGVLLGNLFQDRLGGTVDQILGLLQAEAGERAHLLDDLDLLVAGGGQDDVELVLLLD